MKTQHEIKLYYNNLAPEYDNDRFDNSYGKYIDRQERQVLSRLLINKPISETLDLACGTGRFLEFANYGADISPQMLEEAQRKYPDRKLFEYDALNTGFEAEQFSTVLSFHFIMHLNKEATVMFLKEAHRLLKVGGRLIFDFPSESRRKLIGYKSGNWHGANSMSLDYIRELSKDMFIVRQSYGILFFPIHRFPKRFRFPFYWIDSCICRSFLRKYASYQVVVLEKK